MSLKKMEERLKEINKGEESIDPMSARDDGDSLSNPIVSDYSLFEGEVNRLKMDNINDLVHIDRDTEKDFLADSLRRVIESNPEFMIKAIERDNDPYAVLSLRFIDSQNNDDLNINFGPGSHNKDGSVVNNPGAHLSFSIKHINPDDIEIYIGGLKLIQNEDSADYEKKYTVRNTGNGCLTINIDKDYINSGDLIEIVGRYHYIDYNEENDVYGKIRKDIPEDDESIVLEVGMESIGGKYHSIEDISILYKPIEGKYYKPYLGPRNIDAITNNKYMNGKLIGTFKIEIPRATTNLQYDEESTKWSFIVFNRNIHKKFTFSLEDKSIFNDEFRLKYPKNDIIPLSHPYNPLDVNSGLPFINFTHGESIEISYDGLKLRDNIDYRILWNTMDHSKRPLLILRGIFSNRKSAVVEIKTKAMSTPSEGVYYNQYIHDSIRDDGIIELDGFNLPLSNKLLSVSLNGFKIPHKNIEVLARNLIKIHRVKGFERVNNVEVTVRMRGSGVLDEFIKEYNKTPSSIDTMIDMMGRDKFFHYINNERSLTKYEDPEMNNGKDFDIIIDDSKVIFAEDYKYLKRIPYRYSMLNEETNVFETYQTFLHGNDTTLKYVSGDGLIKTIDFHKGQKIREYKYGYTGNEVGLKLRKVPVGPYENGGFANLTYKMTYESETLRKTYIVVREFDEVLKKYTFETYDIIVTIDRDDPLFYIKSNKRYYLKDRNGDPISYNVLLSYNSDRVKTGNLNETVYIDLENENIYNSVYFRPENRNREYLRLIYITQDGNKHPVFLDDREYINSVYHEYNGEKVPTIHLFREIDDNGRRTRHSPLFYIDDNGRKQNISIKDPKREDDIGHIYIYDSLSDDGITNIPVDIIENTPLDVTENRYLVPYGKYEITDNTIDENIIRDNLNDPDFDYIYDSNIIDNDEYMKNPIINSNIFIEDDNIILMGNVTSEQQTSLEKKFIERIEDGYLRSIDSNIRYQSRNPFMIDANRWLDMGEYSDDDKVSLHLDSTPNENELLAYHDHYINQAYTNPYVFDSNEMQNNVFPSYYTVTDDDEYTVMMDSNIDLDEENDE